MDLLFIAPMLLFFIAFIFSMLGMSGSQLSTPILFWLGTDFKTQVIPLGMLLNVVNSASAAGRYGKKKLIDWKVAALFSFVMMLFAPLDTWLNISLPTKPVILTFAIFTAAAALLMLNNLETEKRKVLGVSSSSILGFFAGLIGRGGGSFVVPLLYMVGLGVKTAALPPL